MRNQKSEILPRLHGLAGLTLTAHRLVDTLLTGEHRSRHLGPGAEFHDYRPYSPGDDAAGIDWKRYARTDRLYLRRHRRESDLTLLVLLDISASMAYPAPATPATPARSHPKSEIRNPKSKLTHARELAAALVLIAARQGDRAGLALAGDGLVDHLPPGPGWPHAHRLCRAIEQADDPPGPGDLPRALRELAGRLRAGTVLAVVSDLLDDPAACLDAFARHRRGGPGRGRPAGGGGGGGGVIVLQVLSPAELDIARLPPGPHRLRDPETGRTHAADPRQVAGAYARGISRHLAALASGCRQQHARYALARTDRPAIDALRHVLRQALT